MILKFVHLRILGLYYIITSIYIKIYVTIYYILHINICNTHIYIFYLFHIEKRMLKRNELYNIHVAVIVTS